MIGIIGGTGPLGKGLAYRLAVAGVDVLLGSRNLDRAQEVAGEVANALGTDASGAVEGAVNDDLPARSDVLLVTVPHAGLGDALTPLAHDVDGTVVISAVNRLGFAGGIPHLVTSEAGSSAHEVAALLPGARVVTAFNHVSAVHLADPDHVFDQDVLVCGDDPDAVALAVALADRIEGLRGIASGPLSHAATIEAMTAVLISINKGYKTNAGVRITGL